jgi:hypothetical protein
LEENVILSRPLLRDNFRKGVNDANCGLHCAGRCRAQGRRCSLRGPFQTFEQERPVSGGQGQVRRHGKLLFKTTFTVSADGMTLTEAATVASPGKKIAVVYDRQ